MVCHSQDFNAIGPLILPQSLLPSEEPSCSLRHGAMSRAPFPITRLPSLSIFSREVVLLLKPGQEFFWRSIMYSSVRSA